MQVADIVRAILCTKQLLSFMGKTDKGWAEHKELPKVTWQSWEWHGYLPGFPVYDQSSVSIGCYHVSTQYSVQREFLLWIIDIPLLRSLALGEKNACGVVGGVFILKGWQEDWETRLRNEQVTVLAMSCLWENKL